MKIEKRHIVLAAQIVVPVAAAVAGFVAGRVVAKQEFDKTLEHEVEEVRDYYNSKLSELQAAPKVRTEQEFKIENFPGAVSPEIKTLLGKMFTNELQTLTDKYGENSGTIEDRDDVIVEEEDPTPDDAPFPEGPHVISEEDFHDGDFKGYTYRYFMDDDVLIDDQECPITDVGGTVGHHAIQVLERSKDGVIHVRNPRISRDYEIVREEGSYQEMVLGIIDHEDKPKLRKFRLADD